MHLRALPTEQWLHRQGQLTDNKQHILVTRAFRLLCGNPDKLTKIMQHIISDCNAPLIPANGAVVTSSGATYG